MRVSTALRLPTLVALLCAVAVLTGCAFGEMRFSDPLDREISLEDAQRRYTVLVRWSDFDRAVKYVDPELRDDFMEKLPNFRELRFTEYESEPVEMDEGRQTATVEVTYYAYSPTTPMETEIHETQEWYRDDGVANNWHVRPTFEGIEALLAHNER